MIQRVRQRVKQWFHDLVHMGESPTELARAFAIGVFIAFTPFIGGHTLLSIAAIWMFRVNPVAVLTGACITNPWTMVPLHGFCLWLGIQLWPGSPEWHTPSMEGMTIVSFLEHFRPYLVPFAVGSLVVSIVGSAVGYVTMRGLVEAYRRRPRLHHGARHSPRLGTPEGTRNGTHDGAASLGAKPEAMAASAPPDDPGPTR